VNPQPSIVGSIVHSRNDQFVATKVSLSIIFTSIISINIGHIYRLMKRKDIKSPSHANNLNFNLRKLGDSFEFNDIRTLRTLYLYPAWIVGSIYDLSD